MCSVIGFKKKVLGCVIGRRRITIQPSPSGLAKTIILKPIVFVHKWPFPAIWRQSRRGRDRSEIVCAAYNSGPQRNVADFLELSENCPFLERKLSGTLNEIVGGDDLRQRN